MALRPSELTDRIEAAFEAEWARTKPIPLPAAGADDRRLLFGAVARGVLAYLKEKEDELLATISVEEAGQPKELRVIAADLDVVPGG